MTAITFDTLAYVKKLKKAGFPEKQAEAQAEMTAELMKDILDNQVATKQDLLVLKSELTLRMGTIVGAGVTTILTLMPIILKLVKII